jgi:hypothetical protein
MMWRLATILLFTLPALAQQVTTAERLPALMSTLDAGQTRSSLPCTVEFTKPKLNLAFRFQLTYSLEVPLDAYVGAAHRWRIVFRVTPAGGQPVYFADSIDLPADAQRGFDAVSTGVFFSGEGHYDVQWSMWDDLDRVCRHEWSFDAQRTRSERGLKVAMPPGTVGDLSWHPVSSGESVAAKSRRITILMNSALPLTKQAQPAKGEWTTLLTILSSLLERLPEASVRLVVFNLDQHQEVYSKDGFNTSDLNGIAHAGDATGRWKVDSNVLQNPSGMWDLLEGIETREAHASPPPDTVVFLGLPATTQEKMPVVTAQPGSSNAPRFVYLVYRPTNGNRPAIVGMGGDDFRGGGGGGGGRGGGGGGGRGSGGIVPNQVTHEPLDPVEEAVQRMKGKTIGISTPDELNKAIADLRHLH